MQEKNKIKILHKDNYFITKGLSKYGKEEIIIALDMDEKLAEEILKKYCENIIKEDIIPEKDEKILNCRIYFKKSKKGIILVFPDPYGKYPWEDGCDSRCRKQLSFIK